MVALSFYVPNFTEDIPTLIVKNSRTIKSSDVEGQEVIQKIDNLTLHGIELANESHIRVLHNKKAEFYIQLITNQKDLTERFATIGIYGRLPSLTWEYSFEDWVFDVLNKVKEFSNKINRLARPEHLRAIRTELKTISYKYKQRMFFMYTRRLILGFVIPLVVSVVLALLLRFLPVLNLRPIFDFSFDFNTVFDYRTVLLVGCFISVNNILIILLVQEKNS